MENKKITAKSCRRGGEVKGLFRYIPKERIDQYSHASKSCAAKREPPQRVNQHHAHKINDRELDAIRYLYLEGGVTQCALATAFGLSQGNVSKIVRGIYHRYELGDFISETMPTGRKRKVLAEVELLPDPFDDGIVIDGEECKTTVDTDIFGCCGYEETLARIAEEGNTVTEEARNR